MAIDTHKYVEMTEQYERVENVNGVVCTRIFHDDGPNSSTITLPAMSDRLSNDTDSEDYNVFVTERVKRKAGGHPTKHIWTIRYGSDPVTSPSWGNISTTNLPTTTSIGGELVSLPYKSDTVTAGYTWKTGADAVAKKIEQTIPVRIGSGSFTITKRVADLKLKDYAEKAGRLNNANLTIASNTFAKGTVLFEGAKATEYRNEKGLRRWRIEFSFVTKMIDRDKQVKSGLAQGWNLLLNEKTGKFDNTIPLLYSYVELASLLTLPEQL